MKGGAARLDMNRSIDQARTGPLTASRTSPPDEGDRRLGEDGEARARFFELSADLFCTATFDGRLRDLNEAWEWALGYSRDQLVGAAYLDFVHPDDRAKTRSVAERLANAGARVERFENRYRSSDGSYRELLWTAQTSATEDLIYAVAKDVTGRNQAERALSRAQQAAIDGFESAPVGMLVVSLEPDLGRIERANDAFCQLLGRSHEEVVGADGASFSTHEDLECHREHMRPLMAGEAERADFEWRYVRPDGEEIWIVLHASLLPVEQPDPERLCIVLAEDVTESRRARLELAEREAHFRAVFDNALDAMLILDDERRFVSVNAAAGTLFGVAPEAVLGKTAESFGVDGLTPDGEAAWRLLIDNGEGTGEVRIRRADGAEIAAEYSATASFAPGRHLAILRDISARKQAELELERSKRQQTAIATVGERALQGVELSSLMDDAVAIVSQTLDVGQANVLEVMPGGDRIVLRAARGWPAGSVGSATAFTGTGSQAGFTLQSESPVVATDVRSDGRFTPSSVLLEQGVESSLSVVIQGRGAPYGVLAAHSKSRREFRPDEVAFMQSIANVLSEAVARHGAEQEMRERALHDHLTGLPNRELFLDRLGHALDRSRRGRSSVAMMFLDIDHFKLINDSLGHDAGDRLLQEVAARVQEALRPSDTVARLAGDEFVVLCEDIASEDDTVPLIERIMGSFERPFALADDEQHVTISVGVVLAAEQHARPEDLIHDADAAMYRAKQGGRARYELFDDAMRTRVIERVCKENALRGAADRGELHLLYQPIVSLSDGELSGVEALVRWSHPELGAMLPADFMAVAEESGLVVPVGRYVLETACREAQRWVRAADEVGSGAVPGVAVNLSARQVMQPECVAMVSEVLEATALDPSRLQLEITESVLMEESSTPVESLAEIRGLGVSLALDDFGRGYSSLSYLKRFPIERLKLDGSFVGDIGRDDDNAAIVRAVIDMAQSLGLSVVAEEVETREQLDHLKALGCDCAQGHLFSRPVPPDQLTRLLAGPLPWQSSGLA